jgi:hypothetical protein
MDWGAINTLSSPIERSAGCALIMRGCDSTPNLDQTGTLVDFEKIRQLFSNLSVYVLREDKLTMSINIVVLLNEITKKVCRSHFCRSSLYC